MNKAARQAGNDGASPTRESVFVAAPPAALAAVAPTHVFITTWMRQDTEAEDIRVNAALVRNLLDALSPQKNVRHVALATGLKHYLGPFEADASSGTLPDTPLRESQPRLPLENFYHAQEDVAARIP